MLVAVILTVTTVAVLELEAMVGPGLLGLVIETELIASNGDDVLSSQLESPVPFSNGAQSN